MVKRGTPHSERLWNDLAWASADLCKLRKFDRVDPALSAAVGEVGAQLWTEDEFPLSRVRQSEQLGIDFLSDPQPSCSLRQHCDGYPSPAP